MHAHRHPLTRTLLALLLALLLSATATACSDDETSSDGGGTPAADDGGNDDGDSSEDGDDADDGDDGEGGLDAECEDVVSLDEASELFGATAQLSTEGDLGEVGGAVISCVYETPPSDDLDSVDHLLQVRAYPGKEYYDPDMIYPDHEDIEGLGDDAFVQAQGSVATGYVEGDVAVFVDYSVIDINASEPVAPTRKDDVVALLRTVHDRLG